MTSHPLLDTIDAFAQEVQSSLSAAEARHRRSASAYDELIAWEYAAKMLHTIRAQAEAMIEDGKPKDVCPVCKGTGLDLLNSPFCLSCGGLGKPFAEEAPYAPEEEDSKLNPLGLPPPRTR